MHKETRQILGIEWFKMDGQVLLLDRMYHDGSKICFSEATANKAVAGVTSTKK